jgi:hypothetical protein
MPNRNRQRNTRPMNSIRQQISRLNREINPCVKVSPARTDPKPTCQSKTFWVRRVISVIKSSSTNSATQVTIGDISTALSGLTSGTPFRVLGFNVWNSNLGGALSCSLAVKALTLGATTENVTGTDFGTGSRLAGLRFNIPDPISQSLTVDTSSAFTVATLVDPKSIATSQGFIVQLSIAYQTV